MKLDRVTFPRYSTLMIGLTVAALLPATTLLPSCVLDVLLGKAEEFDYISTTEPATRPYES